MKTHDPFEELFRKGLGNHKLTPPAGLWDKIDSQVNPVPLEDAFRTGMQGKLISPPPSIWARIEQELERNKPRILWMWYHSAAAALFVASLLAGAFWFNQAQENTTRFAESPQPAAAISNESKTPASDSAANAASVISASPEKGNVDNAVAIGDISKPSYPAGQSEATNLVERNTNTPHKKISPQLSPEEATEKHNLPVTPKENLAVVTAEEGSTTRAEETKVGLPLLVLQADFPNVAGNLAGLYVPAISQTANAAQNPPNEPKAKGNSRFNFYIGANSSVASYNPRMTVLQPDQILSGHDGSDFAELMERATGVSHTHGVQTELGFGKVFFRTGLGLNNSLFRLESTALNDTIYVVDPGLDPLGRDSIRRTDRYVHTLEVRQQNLSIPAMLGIRLGKKRLQAVLASGIVWQQALGQRTTVSGEMPYAYQLPTAQSRLDLRTEVGMRYALLPDRLFIQVAGQYQNSLQEIYRDERLNAQPQQFGINGQLLFRLK